MAIVRSTHEYERRAPGRGRRRREIPADNDDTAPTATQSAPAPVAKVVDPLEEAKAEIARVRDQLLRTAADFDNFRKRTRRELEDARKRGREELLKDFLPVFDNLERAMIQAARPPTSRPSPTASLVLKQFVGHARRVGIKQVPTVGRAFDPSLHEAIQQVETDEHPPGTVVAEVQPGYARAIDWFAPRWSSSPSRPKSDGEGDNGRVTAALSGLI